MLANEHTILDSRTPLGIQRQNGVREFETYDFFLTYNSYPKRTKGKPRTKNMSFAVVNVLHLQCLRGCMLICDKLLRK